MANESNLISADVINPQKYDFTIVGTGGTLTGSHVLELFMLKAAFTGAEGKVRFLNAIDAMKQKVIETTWPLT